MNQARNFAKHIFGISNISSLKSFDGFFVKRFKIVVFSPKENADELISAMASAGAGLIGHYAYCSFRSPGTGTFKGDESTLPAIGIKGRFESADEVRLEMICDKENIPDTISAMLNVHPYEEPAFEIYEILTSGKNIRKNIFQVSLKKPIALKKVIEKMNSKINLNNIPDIQKTKIREVFLNFSGLIGITFTDSKNNLLITKIKNCYTFELN